MAIILYGKPVRDRIAAVLGGAISEASGSRPTLAIIQIGKDRRSDAYIKQKKLFAQKIGVPVRHIELRESADDYELARVIDQLNRDPLVHGIIIQLPLPDRLDRQKILDLILPKKDIDGLTTANQEALRERTPQIVPATARGIVELIDHYRITVSGKKVVVMGRSTLVGKPVERMLLGRGADVEVVHSQTISPKKITRTADILIVAIGKPSLVDDQYVKAGAAVIDVGINSVLGRGASAGLFEEIPKEKLVGDVAFDKVAKIATAISPVPGGVGPMTVAALFENLVDAWRLSSN
jgi:5,10-methylene-tetrahydrofolate dehydrogenase/methenyl tetrahydrofolate cyclohydrolase